MTTTKPNVFISSTIYDFRDLRSALKYWLEELGYDVYLSEQNDFLIASDKNSYESCFQAIDQCDYFILLIGSRVGGWYDKENRVSITQAEYRRAYKKLTEEGTIKILTFVRRELWDVREDRKELQRFLEKEDFQSIKSDQKTAIAQHQSKFAEDAGFIFSFIEEVGRHNEMKKSIQGRSALPIGNWIYTFNGFEDIINSLERMFGVKSNLYQKKMLYCLKRELIENLSYMMLRCDEKTIAPSFIRTDRIYQEKIMYSKFAQERILLPYEDISAISFFTILASGIRFSSLFAEKAILEGTYLMYDNQSHEYVETPLHAALVRLNRHLFQSRMDNMSEQLSKFHAFVYQLANFQRPNKSEKIYIDKNLIIFPLGLYLHHKNILIIILRILDFLDGNPIALDNIESTLVSTLVFSDSGDIENDKKIHPSLEETEKWASACRNTNNTSPPKPH